MQEGPSSRTHDTDSRGDRHGTTGAGPVVSLSRCPSYERGRVEAALSSALLPLGGMEAFVPAGSRVLLKPNLLKRAAPEDAVTTHPEVVRAVVRAAFASGAAEVIVGDSPGGPQTPRSFAALCEAAGMSDVCVEEGASLVLLGDPVRVEVPPAGRRRPAPGAGARPRPLYTSFELSRTAVESDVLINLPKLKTHGSMMMTAAVKNLFGLIPGLAKARYHLLVPDREDFGAMLVDVALACPPALNVLDAVTAMEGDGPGGGDPVGVGLLAASPDPFMLDAVASAVCGFRPEEVYSHAVAHARGLTPLHADDVPTAGPDRSEFSPDRFHKPARDLTRLMPGWLRGRMRDALTQRPVLESAEGCEGCEVCEASCPVDAIEMVPGPRGEVPRIDYDACIRCYCCQELCPPQVIGLKSPWILRWIARREQGRA